MAPGVKSESIRVAIQAQFKSSRRSQLSQKSSRRKQVHATFPIKRVRRALKRVVTVDSFEVRDVCGGKSGQNVLNVTYGKLPHRQLTV